MKTRIVVAAAAVLFAGVCGAADTVNLNFDSRESSAALGLADGELRPGRRGGQALQLDPRALPAKLNAPAAISSSEGTVSLWFKPSTEAVGSQPLLTLRWKNADGSYFAISQGWWEPLGARRFYFIVSNQEQMHCSVERLLDPDRWQHVAVTWRAGSAGSCKVFIDGAKVVEHERRFAGGREVDGSIVIGADLGTTDQRGRRANGLVDDLTILPRALSETEVDALYERQSGGRRAAEQARWHWLRDALDDSSAPSQVAASAQRRVLFDESWQWARSRASVDAVLDKVAAGGFNVIVPCVWHGAGAYFPTQAAHIYEPLQRSIAASFDPLAYLLERAHERGIEVHPWFTVVRRDDERYPRFFSEGVPAQAYDVHNAAFRDFIVELITDVARRYPVDGVNLDYIRAMGICTSTRCADAYRESTQQSLRDDIARAGVDPVARQRIQRWQDQAVVDIVRRLSVGVRAARPGAVISVDGHPTVEESHRPLEGRNDIEWVRAGYVDVIFGMDYRTRIDPAGLDQVGSALGDPRRLILLASNFDRLDGVVRPRPGEVVADLAELSLRRWGGAGVYILAMLTREQQQALRSGPFARPAAADWPARASDGEPRH